MLPFSTDMLLPRLMRFTDFMGSFFKSCLSSMMMKVLDLHGMQRATEIMHGMAFYDLLNGIPEYQC